PTVTPMQRDLDPSVAAIASKGAILRSPTDAEGAPALTSSMRQTPTLATEGDLQRPSGDTQRAAYRRVFELWGQPMDDSDIPCNVAARVGLQCLRDTGGWNALARMDRPAVLELWDADSQPFYAVAIAIDGDRMDVDVGGAIKRIARAALEQHWYGAFVVLWRMPPDYHGRLQVGDAGPTTAWLRRQLASVQSTKLESEHPDVFDQALHDALVRFQRSAGVV